MSKAGLSIYSMVWGIGSAWGSWWVVERYLEMGPYSVLAYLVVGAIVWGGVFQEVVKDRANEKIVESDKL